MSIKTRATIEELHQVEHVRFNAGGIDGVSEGCHDLLGHKPAEIFEGRKTVRSAPGGVLKRAGNPQDDLFQAVHRLNVRPFSPSRPERSIQRPVDQIGDSASTKFVCPLASPLWVEASMC